MAQGFVLGSGGGASLEQTGSNIQFVYVSSPNEGEELVATTATVGGEDKTKKTCYPIYLKNGEVTELKATLSNNCASANKVNNSISLNDINGNKKIFDGSVSIDLTSGVNYATKSGEANHSLSADTATYASSAGDLNWVNATNTNEFNVGGVILTQSPSDPSKTIALAQYNTQVKVTKTNVLMGAAWNDYAELRESSEKTPGICLYENHLGILNKTTKRLQKGCYISTDTYGMIIGRNGENAIPISVAGRVLAYLDNSKVEVGDAVCSGKDGTVSKMSRLEIILFPDRIIGFVSEIPTYDEWNGIKINGRIWIKVK